MIGCLWTRVRKQPIIELYFESENKLQFYNLEAWLANINFLLNPLTHFFKCLKVTWGCIDDDLNCYNTVKLFINNIKKNVQLLIC